MLAGEDWVIREVTKTRTGLYIREVQGRKNPLPGTSGEDRLVQIYTKGWVNFTTEDQAFLLERVARNEERLYPPPRYRGHLLVMDMLRDVPLLGAEAAYEKHVEGPRRTRADLRKS